MTRPIIEANIDVEPDDPEIMGRFAYLAQYLEEGDSLNIRAGGHVIRTKVTGLEKIKGVV